MGNVRKETVVTINRFWATPDGEAEIIDIIIPADATDFMVTEYDGAETLYIVEGGKIKEYNDNKRDFVFCGEKGN